MNSMDTQCLGVWVGHPVPGLINMGPGPAGWGLGVGLTTAPRKKCLLGNEKCGLGKI